MKKNLKPCSGEAFTNYEHACEHIYASLKARVNDPVLCISHGSHAPYLRTRNGLFRISPSPVENVVNTLGAGDAFMAGVIAGLLNDSGEEESLRLGHRIAGAVISQAEPQLSEAALQALKAA